MPRVRNNEVGSLYIEYMLAAHCDGHRSSLHADPLPTRQ